MSIGFNLPVTSRRSSSLQGGLRLIGQIMPEVLANYAQDAPCVAADGCGNRASAGGRMTPRAPVEASRSAWSLSTPNLLLASTSR